MEESEYMQKIDMLDGGTIIKAMKFAAEMVKTVNYSDSKQNNKDVVENNIFIGRLGEEAASIGFQNLGYKVIGPDYTIYKPKDKRWKYDLTIENNKGQRLGVNVFTQASSQVRYHGVNWIVQSIDKGRKEGRKDPIQSDPDRLVCLVELDDSFRWYPCIVYRLYRIGDLKISDAKGKYFGIKKVIRKEDLPCFKDTKDTSEQYTIDDAWKVTKIYYSHAKNDYDTQYELDNMNAIRAKYPDAIIFNPKELLKRSNYVTPKGFSEFIKDLKTNCYPKIDECDIFVVSKYKHGKYTTGVKKEIEYAKFKGKVIEDFDLPYPEDNKRIFGDFYEE